MALHLEAAADATPFHPEAARRLGLQAFTSNLPLTRSDIESFVAHPHQFLNDIYSQLDTAAHAALALVYSYSQRGLPSPLKLDGAQQDIIERADATVGATGKALTTLTGTFLRQDTQTSSRAFWSFRHPTLREGFAVWLTGQHHLLPAILAAMDDEAVLDLTECLTSGSQQQGTLLRLPAPLYPAVAKRLAALFEEWPDGSCWTADALRYLGHKCSDSMLRTYLYTDPSLPLRLTEFDPFSAHAPEPCLLARLHGLGILTERHRHMAVNRMANLAVTWLDAAWLDDEPWKSLLTNDDRTRLFDDVRRLLVPRLKEAVNDYWTNSVVWRIQDNNDGNPPEHVLSLYQQAFKELGDNDTAEAFTRAIEDNRRRVDSPRGNPGTNQQGPTDSVCVPNVRETARSIFADIEEGD